MEQACPAGLAQSPKGVPLSSMGAICSTPGSKVNSTVKASIGCGGFMRSITSTMLMSSPDEVSAGFFSRKTTEPAGTGVDVVSVERIGMIWFRSLVFLLQARTIIPRKTAPAQAAPASQRPGRVRILDIVVGHLQRGDAGVYRGGAGAATGDSRGAAGDA